MMTFLPFEDFSLSAKCLDIRRLGKQRVECLQLLRAIGDKTGWRNHPVAKMWEHNVYSLYIYSKTICKEWKSRRYKDTCLDKINQWADVNKRLLLYKANPYWLDDPEIHSNHRSILLGKNFPWYSQFGWKEHPARKNEKGQWPYRWDLVKRNKLCWEDASYFCYSF